MWYSAFVFMCSLTSLHPELSHFTDTICFLSLHQFVFHFKSCLLYSASWPCKSISCTVSNKYFPEIWMNYVNDFIFINSVMYWNNPNTFVIHDLLLIEARRLPLTKSHLLLNCNLVLINASIIFPTIKVTLTSLYSFGLLNIFCRQLQWPLTRQMCFM